MRVLHLIHNYYPSLGGSQQVFQAISETLAGRFGDEVTVFTTNALHMPAAPSQTFLPVGTEIINGVRVERFPFMRGALSPLQKAIYLARFLKLKRVEDHLALLRRGPLSLRMWQAVRRADVDVIAATAFNFLHMYYPLMLPSKPIPLIYFGALHITPDARIPPTVLRAIQRASAYIAYTEYERRVLIEQGIAESKVFVVEPAVDRRQASADEVRDFRARHGIGREVLIGFVGRQAAYKGIDSLIGAMRQVWVRHPETAVMIAGAQTEFAPQIRALIDALPPDQQPCVKIIHDFSEVEKPALFGALDVLVSVSAEESFGLVYLEAWAQRKPVIGARIGAVESVIRDGHDGLLVNTRDPQQLAGAISTLIEHDEMRAALGANGQAKVRDQHDWTVVTERAREIYTQFALHAR